MLTDFFFVIPKNFSPVTQNKEPAPALPPEKKKKLKKILEEGANHSIGCMYIRKLKQRPSSFDFIHFWQLDIFRCLHPSILTFFVLALLVS